MLWGVDQLFDVHVECSDVSERRAFGVALSAIVQSEPSLCGPVDCGAASDEFCFCDASLLYKSSAAALRCTACLHRRSPDDLSIVALIIQFLFSFKSNNLLMVYST